MNLQTIQIKDITIDSRMRKSLNNFDALVASIDKIGLQQPIIVTNDLKLVAGFRRLEAFKELKKEEIPAIILEKNQSDYSKIIELVENEHREGFTWADRLLGKKVAWIDLNSNEKSITVQEFALLLSQSAEYTYREKLLWEYIEKRPKLLECESQLQAYNLFKQERTAQVLEERNKRRREFNQKISLDFQTNIASIEQKQLNDKNEDLHDKNKTILTPPIIQRKIYLYNDALKCLQDQKDKSIDCCLTDPPYNIDYQGTLEQKVGIYDDDYDCYNTNWNIYINQCIKELARILKPGSHCYFFTGTKLWYQVFNMFIASGFTCYPVPLIWYKENYSTGARTSLPGYYPGNCYETILFAFAPGEKRKLIKQNCTNVLEFDGFTSMDKSKTHPFEKPKDLICELLSRSINVGDTIIDPFCGTGNVLIEGSKKFAAKCLGAEQKKEYQIILEDRLHELSDNSLNYIVEKKEE